MAHFWQEVDDGLIASEQQRESRRCDGLNRHTGCRRRQRRGTRAVLTRHQSRGQKTSRIFIGLRPVGARGCFDECNRLEERILSAVSQQVQTIQQWLVSRAKNPNTEIELVGKSLQLNKNIGVPRPICLFELSKDSTVRNLHYNQSKLYRSLATAS